MEDALAHVSTEISQQVNGEDWVLLEAYACHQDPAINGPCLSQEPIADMGQAEYMHAVFVPRGLTVPNIEALMDLRTSPPGLALTFHQEPFLQDFEPKAFPPASGVTFAGALEKLRATMPGAKMKQASFRKPVHPCATEDLFQFVLSMDTDTEGSVMSVGVETGSVCMGFVTETSDLKMCDDPVCFEPPLAV